MILRDIADCLQQQQRMTGRELARQFQTSEDAIDAMIGVWMRKGRVRKVSAGGCSGSCCGATHGATGALRPRLSCLLIRVSGVQVTHPQYAVDRLQLIDHRL